MPRRDPGPGELEALDPLTGESLRADATLGVTSVSDSLRSRRSRRLRALRLVFVALAVACAATAAYFGLTVLQLRGVERTWRNAMAVDAARAAADRKVVETLAEEAEADDDALAGPFEAIGNDAAARFEAAGASLDGRRIVDSKVSALRDQMIEALRFRRFQMSPRRGRIGDTPLQEVELALHAQLDRWGLHSLEVSRPTIPSLAPQLAKLRHFADAPTGTVLFAVRSSTELLTIDVDASSVRTRTVPRPILHLVPVRGGVGVVDDVELTVYPADPLGAPIVRAPASRGAVAAGDGTGDVWVVGDDGMVRRLHPTAGQQPALGPSLPPARTLVGAASSVLVLADLDDGRLELWSPTTKSVNVIAAAGARFLSADGDFVVWQGPLPFGDTGSDGFLHRLAVSAGQRDLLALARTDATSADLSSDGTIAVAAGPLAGRLGSVLLVPPGETALLGANGPRTSVEAQSLAWSGDGAWLFWRTPDGRIAVRGRALDAEGRLVRSGLEGLESLVAAGR